MENMTVFFREMLQAVAAFLGTEPVIYIFGLVCLAALRRCVTMETAHGLENVYTRS